MNTVPDDVVVCILRCLELEDLLACSRVSHRLNGLTRDSQVWRKLCDDFGYSRTVQAEEAPATWRHRFQDSFCQQRKSKRLERQARLMKVRSEVQEFQLITHKRKRSLHNQLRRVKGLQQELDDLQRKRDAHSAVNCWQPMAVKHHHMQLLTGFRTETTWAIRDVEQRLKDTQLMIGGLRKVLQNSDRQLHSMRQRVHVMEGR